MTAAGPTVDARRATRWAVMGLAVAYVAAALVAPGLVGVYHDDGIYVGTAISLAGGGGYRIPHLPAVPLQAKYPPLFPLLLTPVAWWTGGPGTVGLTPGALAAFRWPVVACVLAALAMLPGCFRRWGMDARAAIWATVLTGCSPLVFQHGFHAMSEGPFLACSVAALRLLPPPGATVGRGRWAAAAAAVVAAVWCRAVGVALIPAAVVAAWPRRRELRAWAPAAAGVLAFAGWTALAGAWRAAEAARDLGPFYDYYLGYGAWVPSSAGTVAVVAARNGLGIWAGVGTALCGARLLGVPAWWLPAGVLGGAALAGWRWLPRAAPAGTAYLAASLGLFLLWPFPVDRFLIPLTPFAVWGLWRAAAVLRARGGGAARVRVIGGLACCLTCALADVRCFPSATTLPLLDTRIQAAEYARTAAWLRANTAPTDVVVADADPWVWLATGRRAIPPGAVDPTWYYTRPPTSPDRWAGTWERAFDADAAEVRRLGGRWVVAGGDWDPYLDAIWFGGLRRDAARYPHRFQSREGPGARLHVFVVGE